MKKTVELEPVLEALSTLRAYMLDNARLQKESELFRLSQQSTAEARGIELAMESLKKEAKRQDETKRVKDHGKQ